MSDEDQEPVVVDWRAPVAEPFYRATGRHADGPGPAPPLRHPGPAAARHRGRAVRRRRRRPRAATPTAAPNGISGHGALISALETSRIGQARRHRRHHPGRAGRDHPGRAARRAGGAGRPRHRQDGRGAAPRRLPALHAPVPARGPGRAGGRAQPAVPRLHRAGAAVARRGRRRAGRAGRPRRRRARCRAATRGLTARVKGDLRMVKVLRRAVRDRERPLRQRPGGRLRPAPTCASTVAEQRAHRRARPGAASAATTPAAGSSRPSCSRALARSQPRRPVGRPTVRDRLRGTPDVREALEWMWPVLTPAQLLHDLFGSRALLRNAGATACCRRRVATRCYRPRSESVDDVVWTNDDVPLLDEARALLGPRPRARRPAPTPTTTRSAPTATSWSTRPRTCRRCSCGCSSRRSLNGSMTVVGDIAQSTGEWAHADWHEILDHLPDRRPPRRAELTVGYRLPAPNMALAVAGAARWPTPTCRRPGRSARTATRPASCGPAPDDAGRAWSWPPRSTSSRRSAPATWP